MQKSIRKDLRFGAESAREKPISAHVPYLRHVDEETLRTKDGMLLTIIKIDGFCHQTADQQIIDVEATARNTLVRALADSRFAAYAHIVRRRIPPRLGGTFDIPFCRALNERYMASLSDNSMYLNELYLTIIRRGFQGKVGLADELLSRLRKVSGVSERAMDLEARQELREHVANIVKGMEHYGARVLKVVAQERRVASEPLEFLAMLLNGGEPVDMALPRMPLDQYLPTRRITFGRRLFELRGASDIETRFGAMLSIREYPPYTAAGMIDGLLKVPGEFILSQSFALQDRAPVLSEMDRIERQISVSDERGTSLGSAISIARDELVNGRAVMGYHHLSVMALGASIKETEAGAQAITKELQNAGMVVVREDLNSEPVFYAQLPGNFSYIARRALISSRNFCGLASFHNFALGKPLGNHWGPAVSLLQTTSMTPYFFNFHKGEVGNFIVTGPTGSGKTVALLFLLSQAMRARPQPRCAFFDKDRGGEVFIRACGGQYEVLQPGVPTGFNPLQLPDSPDNRAFVYDLLSYLLRPRDDAEKLSAEQEKILYRAVEQIFSVPVRERLFSDVVHLLRGGEAAGRDDLASRFEAWCDTRGWLFNNTVDLWDGERGIFGFDLTAVLDDPEVRTVALGYIFFRIGQMLDGERPMMVFVDEGWKLLSDDRAGAFINDQLKTIRKKNGIVGIGTQSARDITTSRIAHTLLEQSPTTIFFPNPKADRESYVKGFGLSETEFEWVRSTASTSRQFLVKHDHDSVIARLDLSALPDFIKVLSGRAETVAECERLRRRYGDAPELWLPCYCGWSQEPGNPLDATGDMR
ncbi:VirB4 family type IV secretion/conjugal transfer ATPase [Rhizobium sp. VS19-DR104.2]|uniref:VirB4 family type IV secretion/conjugal transfer ATPase n=1 Tax=unclassified Rhizobium TaxID=2613769 RepID=UPI001C5B8F1C|nr:MULTISPECIES: VirB4 family type IV secretion/conjugal transfer ATPase [unclassified Rhizobium]MBZ5763366.1 VirB4 family type IV secretion/conjugal transfer ATPase [Rhizobium sp. VS19-DR96]MBZ5769264.1 VirB4 family type IV secretion/conjugal transfer ATPase [Rhizobium sp. VS19-DR129.2]MBZ5776810.1 VirB4 family type IV secretion/conjugal transfer ATPase [Rhizobium sp. VS19-DRK62.2]MBZ5787885.1 VirB4 family type IV secretion/conjugal transfer ATPase [Rhizobium sp. VS19-DR121]MBZ5805386.1 VirB4